jgi:hypothetical protein
MPPLMALVGCSARTLAATRNRRIAEARGRLHPTTVGTGRPSGHTAARVTSVQLPPGINPIVPVREQEFGTRNGTVTLPADLRGEIRHSLLAAQAGYRGDLQQRMGLPLGGLAANPRVRPEEK